jgi:hypothetical protein
MAKPTAVRTYIFYYIKMNRAWVEGSEIFRRGFLAQGIFGQFGGAVLRRFTSISLLVGIFPTRKLYQIQLSINSVREI